MDQKRVFTDTLTLKYDSKQSRADAKAVGAGLIALEALINEVQKECDHNEALLIKARPFSEGSLKIPIELIIKDTTLLFDDHPTLQKIRKIVSEYFKVKQGLQGQPMKVEEGNIITINNSKIEVDQITVQCLSQKSNVSQTHSKAFQNIENDPEIEKVEIISAKLNESIAKVERSDFASFHPDTPVDLEDYETRHQETEETVIIRQPAFDRELSWRFVWREERITAKVTAEGFLDKVENGESFSSGDSLVVILRRPQIYSPAAKMFVNRQPFIVTEVLKHVKRPTQQNFL